MAEQFKDAESEELKPCPFCGEPGYMHEDHNLYSVWCIVCVAIARSSPIKEEAIKAWNRRASPWRPISEATEDDKKKPQLGIDRKGERAVIEWEPSWDDEEYKGRWTVRHDSEDYVWEGYQPTHFMPLPEPPAPQQDEAGEVGNG